MSYVELQATSNFSFLRGGSHPEELVQQAAILGYKEIGITDRNTLAGIVRGHAAAKKIGIRTIPACRLDLKNGPSLLAYPTNKEAYAGLSALLTEGNLRTEKGKCDLFKADVYRYGKDIKFIAVPPPILNRRFDFNPAYKAAIREYKEAFGKDLYLGAIRTYQGDDSKRLFRLAQLSAQVGIPMIATNDVHYHDASRRELQDILTCIREKCTIHNAGFRLWQNAERFLKPEQEMHRLFLQYPEATRRTLELADACRFSLDELKYIYPEEILNWGCAPQEALVRLTWLGAKQHWGEAIPEHIRETIKMELDFMERKNYAPYFLFVYDIVRFARNNNILCQGRGSAANSVICYCLGITSVDPSKFKVLFARFMSDARDEPPDIDVDFEHERREEVMQYIYNKYGRDRAAIVATVTQVHAKGAIRDVGKAMGLSVDAVDRLAKSVWEFSDEFIEEKRVSSEGFDTRDPHLLKTLQLTREYIGFPRQLGQHTGGFIVTQGKLTDLCPILNARMEDRTNIEWNKDDIESLGFLKVDVLALGMLTCIRKAFDLAKLHYGLNLTLANIPQDDPAVYDMITAADTIGVFQIESRAQMSMLPRLRPKNFYDLVIEVAIVRPGPIQGGMVHPYIRRRNGEEPVEYPSKELEEVLGRTLGVPLFQEQAMEIAIVAAGFTPAEADQLRRSMATFKAKGLVSHFKNKLVSGMVAKGYTEEYALRIFKQLEGFGSYGFPESHAASFALLVYVSSWIKCYYPDIFAASLLNSQPMGFYAPAQIIRNAQKHGVTAQPVDINHSDWDCTLEEQIGRYRALRLGFREAKGLDEESMKLLVAKRKNGYRSISELRDAGISQVALEKLANADAFRSIGLDRREALWEVSALADRPIGMFEGQASESASEPAVLLPRMTAAEHVVQDYSSTSLSLKAHPVSFVRDKLLMLGVTATKDIQHAPNGTLIRVSGLVLVRQRPGTASGVCFITLEDETSEVNVIVWESLFNKFRKEINRSRLLMVVGELQHANNVTHVIARRCIDLTHYLAELSIPAKELAGGVGEETAGPKRQKQKPAAVKAVQIEMFPGGRNFK